MSFENGYDIKEYIGNTIEVYNKDKEIFNKVIVVLNNYMSRIDWPLCYNEFKELAENMMGSEPEFFARNMGMFDSQSKYGHELLKEWDKDLDIEFKKDALNFSSIMSSIENMYYDYINNPLGIHKVLTMDNYHHTKLFRILRVDGVNLDLRMNKYEIEQLIKTLKDSISED